MLFSIRYRQKRVMSFRLAVSATFTAEPIERVLAFWGRQLETAFEIRFAPYNQTIQTLLDPSSEFAANRQGANLLLARLEDLAQFETSDALHELIDLIREAPRRTTVPLIFALCPPSPALPADAAGETARRIETMLEGTPGVFFLGWHRAERHKLRGHVGTKRFLRSYVRPFRTAC